MYPAVKSTPAMIPMVFCGVIRSVTETEGGSRDELQHLKPFVPTRWGEKLRKIQKVIPSSSRLRPATEPDHR